MVKRIVAVVLAVCSLFAAAGLGFNYYAASLQSKTLARELADMENQIAAKEAKNAEVRVEALASAAGISEKRINTDAEAIDAALSVAFTWSSYEEYNRMREMLASEYGFKKDGQFLTDVFAYIPADENDSQYNYIDQNGIKVEYASSKLYCIGVSGMQYHYFGEIYWRVLGYAGGSADMVYGFTLTTNADGTMDDLFVMDISG